MGGVVYSKQNGKGGKNKRALRAVLEREAPSLIRHEIVFSVVILAGPVYPGVVSALKELVLPANEPTCPCRKYSLGTIPKRLKLCLHSYQQADGKHSQPDKEASRSQG